MTPHLIINNLNFSYSNRLVLNEINFEFSGPGLVYIQGDNGSGKTTLLKLVAGLIKSENMIFLNGHMLDLKRQTSLALNDGPGLFPHLTVGENLKALMALHLSPSHFDRAQESVAPLVNDKIHLMPRELSAGMKQSINLAKALMRFADFYLLDEPLTGLDQLHRDQVTHLIQTRLEAGSMVITTGQHEPFELKSLNFPIAKLKLERLA